MLQESKFNKSIIKDKNSNKRASIQLITMIGLTIIIQVVTILKTSVVAAQFGATIEMDAFNFSNSIGVFIFSFIGAGVTTVLIPNLVNKDDDQGVNIFISTLYTIGFIVNNIQESKNEALADAYNMAREKAEAIAKAARKTLKECIKTDFRPFEESVNSLEVS